MIVYGCAAHFVHLIEKEVSPRTVISKIVEVQKYFRNHHLPQGWLREKGGKKPQIPNDTRWTSKLATFDTYPKNQNIYHEICIEHSEEIPLHIFKILNNPNIYMEAMNLYKQLELVCFALDSSRKIVAAWGKLFMNGSNYFRLHC